MERRNFLKSLSASLGAFNDEVEIDRAVEVLRRVIAEA